ncbi:hypothetical protein DRN67_00715, partial [Candidatus Micrarchaeota archaeon]
PRASFVAIKAAVMRYAESLEDYEEKTDLRKLLGRTRSSIRSDVSVIHISPRFKHLVKLEKIYNEAREFVMVNSDNAITVIVDNDLVEDVLKMIGKASVISVDRDNCIVLLTSPPKIERTLGFVAFVSDLLARYGINIKEYYSCYTDTVFILSKKDAIRAYELLESMADY